MQDTAQKQNSVIRNSISDDFKNIPSCRFQGVIVCLLLTFVALTSENSEKTEAFKKTHQLGPITKNIKHYVIVLSRKIDRLRRRILWIWYSAENLTLS